MSLFLLSYFFFLLEKERERALLTTLRFLIKTGLTTLFDDFDDDFDDFDDERDDAL